MEFSVISQDQKFEETESYSFLKLTTPQLTITLIIVLWAYFFLKNVRMRFHLDKFGGPREVPIFGNALQLLRPNSELIPLLDSWFATYKPTFRVSIGSIIPYVLTCDVEIVEKLLTSTSYLEKGKYAYSPFMDWLGTGLVTAPACKWSGRRKMLTPSFHFKILEDFVPVFNEQASILLKCLERDGRNNGEVFNLQPYITRCTLDIICETAMGKKINVQLSTSGNQYFDAVHGMCSIVVDRICKPWLLFPLVYKMTSLPTRVKEYLRILNGFTEEVIQARKSEMKSVSKKADVNKTDLPEPINADDDGIYGKKRKVFLDVLLNAEKLSNADIYEEVNTFMFAGHDTTGVSLAWTILLIAIHPECQHLVHKELDEIFANNPTKDITTNDISKMKYLECCIKESLRIYPSVPLISRQVNEDFQLDDGRIIPRGTTLAVSIYHLHRQEKYFENPEDFIPERWSMESLASSKRNPYSYIPFAAGQRICIGQKFALMEEKILLAKLFSKYTIETKETVKSLRTFLDIFLRCDNGVNVSLRKR